MKKILIDTNLYAAFKQGNIKAIELLKSVKYIGVNVVVYAELICGFKNGSKEEKNRRELETFLDSPRVYLLDVTEETTEYYVNVFTGLRKKGKSIPTNDLWVASSAMEHGLTLCTFDKHFLYVDGLLLKNF